MNALDNVPIAKGNNTATGYLGLEIITANRIKLGRNNFRSLGGDGIQIDLSPDAAQILENNRLIYNCWYQLYIDNVHQLLVRPSKWEKTGRLPQINDIVLFTFTDSGYSKKAVVWKLGQVVASTARSTSISYVSKPTITGPSPLAIIRRNPRDVSVIYAADEFHINTPEHYAQVANNV